MIVLPPVWVHPKIWSFAATLVFSIPYNVNVIGDIVRTEKGSIYPLNQLGKPVITLQYHAIFLSRYPNWLSSARLK